MPNHLIALSHLLLGPYSWQISASPGHDGRVLPPDVAALRAEDRDELLALADSHHVVIRALQTYQQIMTQAGDSAEADWAESVIAAERSRINAALPVLASICDRFETEGCPVVVIKSLDHWPDLGSDLDLYTSAPAALVQHIMQERFHAHLQRHSWGDRLANKWNFALPGLRELVEVHVGRLGQTGEQVAIAHSLIAHARLAHVGNYAFRVACAEDRLIITTLQRMYRHFYLRLCDIVDSAQLLETDTIDYGQLHWRAEKAGIWKGVATLLSVVSDYVTRYRGAGLLLPAQVMANAQFGGDQLSFRAGFLRIPIVPHAMRLYAAELGRLMRNRELAGTFRLSLLPGLATAAVVGAKVTGSDKRVW